MYFTVFWLNPNVSSVTLHNPYFFTILLPVGHAADVAVFIERAVLVHISIYTCFYAFMLLSDAAFGRREAPGRRLAGGGW